MSLQDVDIQQQLWDFKQSWICPNFSQKISRAIYLAQLENDIVLSQSHLYPTDAVGYLVGRHLRNLLMPFYDPHDGTDFKCYVLTQNTVLITLVCRNRPKTVEAVIRSDEMRSRSFIQTKLRRKFQKLQQKL